MRQLCLLALLLFPVLVGADPLLYRTGDDDSTVWILGSVHALRADDYPLAAPIESAYTDAERVVLEVAPAELEPERMLGLLMPMAQSADGRTLEDWFRDGEYRRVQEGLAALGLDAAQFAAFEPWFVALQVFSFNLARFGFAADDGVDAHYAARAKRDKKPTAGLETAREQLLLFDTLPAKTQKSFLFDTLEESDSFREEMQRLVQLWHSGDTQALAVLIEEEFAGEPELRQAMLGDRNRKWVPRIAGYLDQPGDTLVIVGALHLVGDDGVIELLREKGYDVERVEE